MILFRHSVALAAKTSRNITMVPSAEMCTFEEIPHVVYSVEVLATPTASLKQCLEECINLEDCIIAAYFPAINSCKLFKNNPSVSTDFAHFDGITECDLFRLDRHLKRPACPKLSSLP
ncbi:hypothetical protein Q1695_013098 [Nippostrongylus brasiliensis]|nr:hypothetical protein Q1695_013098 [Nippostrongylus brasiliensis]